MSIGGKVIKAVQTVVKAVAPKKATVQTGYLKPAATVKPIQTVTKPAAVKTTTSRPAPVAAPVASTAPAMTDSEALSQLKKEAALTQAGNKAGAIASSKAYVALRTEAIKAQHANETPEQTSARVRAEQGLPESNQSTSGTAYSPATDVISSTDQSRATSAENSTMANRIAGNVSGLQTAFDAETAQNAAQQAYQPTNQYQADVLAGESFGDTAQGKDMMNKIQGMYDQLASGGLSPEEQASVKSQVDATKAQYDILIKQAEMQKEQGMANAMVAAGENGGFINTQFAGLAALIPTNGGDFTGAGGALERIKSSYDENISTLQSQQIQAMAQAQQLTESAIRTGKSEDLAAAQRMYELAKAANDDKISLANDKATAVTTWQKNAQDLAKYNRETASATVDAMAKAGLSPESLPDGYLDGLDSASGYPPGTSEALMNVARDEREVTTFNNAIEQASKLNSLLQTIPVGKTITVGGIDYTSLNQGETSIIQQDEGNGNVAIYKVNKDTGTVDLLKEVKGGSGVGWTTTFNNGVAARINSQTGQIQVLYDSNQPNGGIAEGGLVTAFPQDSVSTFKDAQGKPRTQCGAWYNDVTTGPQVGDSLASKLALADKSITSATAQVGDWIVTSEGGSTGHIAEINSISYSAGGKPIYTLSESNYKKNAQGQGIITHDRQVDGNAVSIKGYISSENNDPQYLSGTGVENELLNTFLSPSAEIASIPQQSALRKEIAADKAIVQYNDLKNSYQSLDAVYKKSVASGATGDKNASDQALITVYNKMLDPTSVVREGEYARTAAGQAVLARAQGFLTQLAQGGAGISDSTRASMVDIAKTLFEVADSAYQESVDYYVPTIEGYGLNPKLFIKGYEDTNISGEQQATADGTNQPLGIGTEIGTLSRRDAAGALGVGFKSFNKVLTGFASSYNQKYGEIPSESDLDYIANVMVGLKKQGNSNEQIHQIIAQQYGI